MLKRPILLIAQLWNGIYFDFIILVDKNKYFGIISVIHKNEKRFFLMKNDFLWYKMPAGE